MLSQTDSNTGGQRQGSSQIQNYIATLFFYIHLHITLHFIHYITCFRIDLVILYEPITSQLVLSMHCPCMTYSLTNVTFEAYFVHCYLLHCKWFPGCSPLFQLVQTFCLLPYSAFTQTFCFYCTDSYTSLILPHRCPITYVESGLQLVHIQTQHEKMEPEPWFLSSKIRGLQHLS